MPENVLSFLYVRLWREKGDFFGILIIACVSADCAVIAYGYAIADDAEEAFLHCETVLSGFR